MMYAKTLPIGVFDSGVGGLTVLRALQQELPHESFLYLGDTARLPYGTKSQDTVIAYAKQAASILIERGVKFLVIACNTATATALPSLKKQFPEMAIVGVIEPGAKAACETSINGQIAVIATEATVKAQGYQKAIHQIRPNAKIVAESCTLFVALAEEGWLDGDIAEAVAERYLEPLLFAEPEFKPDTLILGCTHFPALYQPIKKVAGEKITVIDSAHSTAKVVAEQLKQLNLLNDSHQEPHTHLMVTDAPGRFARVARNFLGKELLPHQIELVDFH
ncbi:MAG: glutamate racemase [Gammaproteobacteria bacterium]|jgi:glutamate racemase|nr:glutamate racemase [Gammaproteobacteria bacterium]